MLKDRRKIVIPIIKNKHAFYDSGIINHYIIGQIKRKIEPLFMRRVIKYKADDGSPFMTNHSQCQDHIALKSIQNKIDSMTERKNKKQRRMQRISSQIHLERIVDSGELGPEEDSADEVPDQTGEKYERLKERVYCYLREQKYKLKKLKEQKENQKKPSIKRQSSTCFITETQRKSTILKSQFNLSSFSENISKIQKPIVRLEKKKVNTSPSSQIEEQQKVQKVVPKHCQKLQKSFEKQSCIDGQKIDEVDRQFEQGLIEQIYTKKRIDFRKKIHENKSKGNLHQSVDNYG